MRRFKYTTEELLAGVTDENIHPAVDWGPDVGKEILPPELFYGTGDATLPKGDGPCIIAHVCNDIGGWGKGFVQPLGRRYPEAETQYRAWFRRKIDPLFALGQVQFVEVAPQVWVANMIAQHGVGRQGPTPPIRYGALRECLNYVRLFAQEQNVSVQMPRIGCGLAGGDWKIISKIVEDELVSHGLFVLVIDLPVNG